MWINIYNFNLPQSEENGPKYQVSEKSKLLSTFWDMDCLGAHEFHSPYLFTHLLCQYSPHMHFQNFLSFSVYGSQQISCAVPLPNFQSL